MKTFIKRVQALATLVAPTKARNEIDKPLKPWNPDLYYGYLHMECYYFCQQCKDHFEIMGLLGHKQVSFTTGFLKDHILSWWQ